MFCARDLFSVGKVLFHIDHFQCNIKQLVQYPNTWAYTREIYQMPGVAETVDFEHIKNHYYVSIVFWTLRLSLVKKTAFCFQQVHLIFFSLEWLGKWHFSSFAVLSTFRPAIWRSIPWASFQWVQYWTWTNPMAGKDCQPNKQSTDSWSLSGNVAQQFTTLC